MIPTLFPSFFVTIICCCCCFLASTVTCQERFPPPDFSLNFPSATIIWETPSWVSTNRTDSTTPTTNSANVTASQINRNITFTGFYVPPAPLITPSSGEETDTASTATTSSSTRNLGYAFSQNPVGFQAINLTTGSRRTFFGIDSDDKLQMIDNFVFVPSINGFVFLIRSKDQSTTTTASTPSERQSSTAPYRGGSFYGRIAAFRVTGGGLWSYMNNDINSPIYNWTWNPTALTPLRSEDDDVVYINFLSPVVSVAAFSPVNGTILWNTTLQDYTDFLPTKAAVGGMTVHGDTIYAGLYDKNLNRTADPFSSSLIKIDTTAGTTSPSDSWVWCGVDCNRSYKGGIVGAPVLGSTQVFATDRFMGVIALSQSNISNLLFSSNVGNDYSPMPLAISDRLTSLLGIRNELYPFARRTSNGLISWTTRAGRLQCDTRSANPNPPPIVNNGIVYYACGTVWYAFVINGGSVYNYGIATTTPDGVTGIFVSMQIVNDILYTTEVTGTGASFITAWSTIPNRGDNNSTTMSPTTSTDSTTPPSIAPTSGAAVAGLSSLQMMIAMVGLFSSWMAIII
jgi:hypothetical protein